MAIYRNVCNKTLFFLGGLKLLFTGRLRDIYTLINLCKSQRYFVYRYIRSYLKNSNITDYLAFMSEYFKKDNALNLKSRDFQDSVALYFSRNRVNNFFVELGAGDGVIRSNTYALEHEGWNGISVEPNSFLQNDFIQIRKTECLPVALINVDNDYLLCFDSDPYLGRLVSKIDLHGSKFENALPIRCMLASEFINQIPQKIDYLSIDIEGMDFEILKTFLESSKEINLISVEFSSKKSKLDILRLAKSNNYFEVFKDFSRNDLLLKKVN